MSNNRIQRRFPVSRRASSRVLKPSGNNRRYTPGPVQRRSSKRHKDTTKILERCKSEPCLLKVRVVDFEEDDDDRQDVTPSLEILFRPQTCSDIFLSNDYNISGSPQSFQLQGYKKEAKVVVNVTVEGSPGPVRTMVKLGSSVDETIRLVIDKYSEEGRTPRLDKNADSTFQLYQSHFSLQSLSKADAIGDIGSRTFHLRRSHSNGSNASNQEIRTEIVPVKPNSKPLVLHEFFARKLNKIIRRACKLWKFLGCMQCSG